MRAGVRVTWDGRSEVTGRETKPVPGWRVQARSTASTSMLIASLCTRARSCGQRQRASCAASSVQRTIGGGWQRQRQRQAGRGQGRRHSGEQCDAVGLHVRHTALCMYFILRMFTASVHQTAVLQLALQLLCTALPRWSPKNRQTRLCT